MASYPSTSFPSPLSRQLQGGGTSKEEQAFADMLQERERERERGCDGGREREGGGHSSVDRRNADDGGDATNSSNVSKNYNNSNHGGTGSSVSLDYRDVEFLRHWERLVDLEQAESQVGVICYILLAP